MKKILLPLVCLLLGAGIYPTPSSGQNGRAQARRGIGANEQYQREDGPAFTLSNKVAIYATPTAVLNPYGAVLPIGASFYFGEIHSISADVSIPLFFAALSALQDDYRDKKIRSDLRVRADFKWCAKVDARRRLFFGIEAQYRRQEFSRTRAMLAYNPDRYYVKGLDATKTSIGGAALFGAEVRLKPRLLLEGMVGFGIRSIVMDHNFDKTNSLPQGFPRGNDPTNFSMPPNEDEVGNQAFAVYVPLSISLKYLLH